MAAAVSSAGPTLSPSPEKIAGDGFLSKKEREGDRSANKDPPLSSAHLQLPIEGHPQQFLLRAPHGLAGQSRISAKIHTQK
jgi:hypothetical protein